MKFSNHQLYVQILKLIYSVLYSGRDSTESTTIFIAPACDRNNHQLADQIVAYIESNSDSATLYSVAEHFGYHHVYLSRLLSEKTGKSFSALLFAARMRRAKLLIDHTDFSIEKMLPCYVTVIAAIFIKPLNSITGSCQGRFRFLLKKSKIP